jgi:hypothetical protein
MMGAEKNFFVYRFRSDRWHTVVPLTAIAVFIETLAGPRPDGLTQYAPWTSCVKS